MEEKSTPALSLLQAVGCCPPRFISTAGVIPFFFQTQTRAAIFTDCWFEKRGAKLVVRVKY